MAGTAQAQASILHVTPSASNPGTVASTWKFTISGQPPADWNHKLVTFADGIIPAGQKCSYDKLHETGTWGNSGSAFSEEDELALPDPGRYKACFMALLYSDKDGLQPVDTVSVPVTVKPSILSLRVSTPRVVVNGPRMRLVAHWTSDVAPS